MSPTVVAEPASRRASDFAAVGQDVRAAGLLDRRAGSAAVRVVATLSLYVAAWVVVARTGDSWWQPVAAVLLGVAFTQVGFLGHDSGHQQVLSNRRANDLFGRLMGNLLIGLSYGWWVGKHNRHHANPNKEDHDPDIGEGVLAFTTSQAAARTGRVSRAIARYQAWLFFPLLALEGLNLHAASVLSLLPGAERSPRGGSRASEGLLLAAHLLVYVGILALVMSPLKALVFVAIHQGVWGLYMGCAFAPNHKGMPTIPADANVDFLRRQVLTSRNIRGGRVTDLVLGGLNYQIEHHLFPNMPRASLRATQRIVRAHCARLDIPYCEASLFGSYAAVLRHLNVVGAPLR